MNIHEHQAKELLREYKVPVLKGFIAFNSKELEENMDILKGPKWVVKAQIHAGGRGKGGGVKVCLLYTSPSPRDVEESRMAASG